jgi:hypothetical protein
MHKPLQSQSAGSLLCRKPAKKRPVFTEETLDEIRARLEVTPQKSLRRLAQETGISKSSAATATKLHKRGPYKATVFHALQSLVPVNTTEGQSLQNEPPYRRRVKGKHTKIMFLKFLRNNFFW